jgi:hypothetical protein
MSMRQHEMWTCSCSPSLSRQQIVVSTVVSLRCSWRTRIVEGGTAAAELAAPTNSKFKRHKFCKHDDMIFVVIPCIFITSNFFSPTNAHFIKHIIVEIYNQNISTFSATCFGPPGPSSGSLRLALLKLQFCGINQ